MRAAKSVGALRDRAQARRGRGRRRTSRRPRPAAPARCRCWTWPCRGGCAARGSAGPGGRPGGPRRRPTPRRAGRAGAARDPRRPPCSRRAGRRRTAARRSAGRSRRRRRRRARRGPPAAVSASRSAATTARRAALVGRLDDRARVAGPRPEAPGYCTSTPRQLALGQAVGEVGDDDLDAHRLGAGADHVDRLRQRVGVDDERAGWPCGCRGVRASSPRRRRCPRRAARRWRSAAR